MWKKSSKKFNNSKKQWLQQFPKSQPTFFVGLPAEYLQTGIFTGETFLPTGHFDRRFLIRLALMYIFKPCDTENQKHCKSTLWFLPWNFIANIPQFAFAYQEGAPLGYAIGSSSSYWTSRRVFTRALWFHFTTLYPSVFSMLLHTHTHTICTRCLTRKNRLLHWKISDIAAARARMRYKLNFFWRKLPACQILSYSN